MVPRRSLWFAQHHPPPSVCPDSLCQCVSRAKSHRGGGIPPPTIVNETHAQVTRTRTACQGCRGRPARRSLPVVPPCPPLPLGGRPGIGPPTLRKRGAAQPLAGFFFKTDYSSIVRVTMPQRHHFRTPSPTGPIFPPSTLGRGWSPGSPAPSRGQQRQLRARLLRPPGQQPGPPTGGWGAVSGVTMRRPYLLPRAPPPLPSL